MKQAGDIVLDMNKGVFIDGIKFPYLVGVDVEVEIIDNALVAVKLPVFANSVTIVHGDEMQRYDKDGDLAEWLRQKGREIYGNLYPLDA